MVLHFDAIYSVFYSIFMLGFHFYKGYGGLDYPPVVWALELLGLIFLSIVQMIRIYFGYYANRMESSRYAKWFAGLSILCLVTILHASFLTTYVLLFEILLGAIIGFLCVIEIFLSLVAAIKFSK